MPIVLLSVTDTLFPGFQESSSKFILLHLSARQTMEDHLPGYKESISGTIGCRERKRKRQAAEARVGVEDESLLPSLAEAKNDFAAK